MFSLLGRFVSYEENRVFVNIVPAEHKISCTAQIYSDSKLGCFIDEPKMCLYIQILPSNENKTADLVSLFSFSLTMESRKAQEIEKV
jgi:hypothetical protein